MTKQKIHNPFADTASLGGEQVSGLPGVRVTRRGVSWWLVTHPATKLCLKRRLMS